MSEGLAFAGLAPGPELGAALAAVDRATLNGHDLVELLTARNRQLGWESAQLLADVWELAHTPMTGLGAPVVRTANADEFAVEEVAFALTWTAAAAQAQFGLAYAVVERLPALFDAMSAGLIDLPKARAIADEVSAVDQSTARKLVDRLLVEAAGLTTGQLRAKLRRLVIEAEPDAARRRHVRAVADRRVERDGFSNGTMALSGVYLPPDRAAAAWDNLDRIATATKAAGGELRTLDQIRADVFCDLLAGVTAGLTTAQRKGSVTVSIELTTLMGFNERPAELAGFGPVVADIARQVVAEGVDTMAWRWAATSAGRTVAEGKLHYRPTAAQLRLVHSRDVTCRAPGCRRPAMGCDVDHVTPWREGGATEAGNLTALCRRHHRAKHRGGYALSAGPLGWDWVTPRGHRYTVVHNGPDLGPVERRLAAVAYASKLRR